MDIKKEYEALAKKYKLPDYEDLDREFELLYVMDIKEIKYVLRFIRRRINDKVAWACTMIQSILQPNPGSLVNLQESNCFNSKDDKQKLFNLLREMMQVERKSLLLDIKSDEKGDAVFINESYKQWSSFKNEISWIAEKMHKHWSTVQEEKKERDRYFG